MFMIRTSDSHIKSKHLFFLIQQFDLHFVFCLKVGNEASSAPQMCRYTAGQIKVVTHRGKKTAQMLCKPKIFRSKPKSEECQTSQEVSSTYSGNMCEQMGTFPVVSNLKELSEMSTLTNYLYQDFFISKIESNNLPQLHCIGIQTADQVRNVRLVANRRQKIRKAVIVADDSNRTKDQFEEKKWHQLKLSYDKHIEHILEQCSVRVESLQHQVSSCQIELNGMKVKLSSSEQAEKLTRKELESVTQVRNWYQERLRQIQSPENNNQDASRTEDNIKQREELNKLQIENRELTSRLTEEKITHQRKVMELEDQIKFLLAAIEMEKRDRDVAEGKLLSHENLMREAQVRVLTIKQERDAACKKLERENGLKRALQERVGTLAENNKTLKAENKKLGITVQELEDSLRLVKVKSNDLEIMLDSKTKELSTTKSELLESVKVKQELMKKSENEKFELEMIIEELQNVKRNIEIDLNRDLYEETKEDKFCIINQKQRNISVSGTDLPAQEESAALKIEPLKSKETNEAVYNVKLFEKQILELTSLLNRTKEELRFYKCAEEEVRQNYQKEKNEKNDLSLKNFELENHLEDLSRQIMEFRESETELNSTICNINENLDTVTSCLETRNSELKMLETKCQDSKVQTDILKEQLEASEGNVAALTEDKLKHQSQMKGLHCALKTSFDHIKSLRKAVEESQENPTYNLDDNSLDQLLFSTRNIQRSSLSSLKLSLFDLKENVRELNIELGSTSVTPNISTERDTPSFLDKLQDTSESVGETPSLHLSPPSSLNSSPAHFIT